MGSAGRGWGQTGGLPPWIWHIKEDLLGEVASNLPTAGRTQGTSGGCRESVPEGLRCTKGQQVPSSAPPPPEKGVLSPDADRFEQELAEAAPSSNTCELLEVHLRPWSLSARDSDTHGWHGSPALPADVPAPLVPSSGAGLVSSPRSLGWPRPGQTSLVTCTEAGDAEPGIPRPVEERGPGLPPARPHLLPAAEAPLGRLGFCSVMIVCAYEMMCI